MSYNFEAGYSDVINCLRECGLDAVMQNTGGGCFAIEFPLDDDYFFWLSDSDGPLYEREFLSGWMLGCYDTNDVLGLLPGWGEPEFEGDLSPCMRVQDPSVAAAIQLVKDGLRDARALRGDGK